MAKDHALPVRPDIRIQPGSAARATWRVKATRLVLRGLFLLIFRVRILGRENMLRTSSIICMNHLGWAEGFMVFLFLPVEPRMYGLGVREVLEIARWRTAFINWLQIYIQLEREKPRQALLAMQEVLRRGGSLALVPEGHLGDTEGTISPLQHGAAYLSQTTGVPLVPVGITGSLELWFRCRLTLRVGKPIYPSEFQGSQRDRTHAMTERLEKEMRGLLPGDLERPRLRPLRNFLTKLF